MTLVARITSSPPDSTDSCSAGSGHRRWPRNSDGCPGLVLLRLRISFPPSQGQIRCFLTQLHDSKGHRSFAVVRLRKSSLLFPSFSLSPSFSSPLLSHSAINFCAVSRPERIIAMGDVRKSCRCVLAFCCFILFCFSVFSPQGVRLFWSIFTSFSVIAARMLLNKTDFLDSSHAFEHSIS